VKFCVELGILENLAHRILQIFTRSLGVSGGSTKAMWPV
jgi:hypothetical protein